MSPIIVYKTNNHFYTTWVLYAEIFMYVKLTAQVVYRLHLCLKNRWFWFNSRLAHFEVLGFWEAN
jgi:hypothetical protein